MINQLVIRLGIPRMDYDNPQYMIGVRTPEVTIYQQGFWAPLKLWTLGVCVCTAHPTPWNTGWLIGIPNYPYEIWLWVIPNKPGSFFESTSHNQLGWCFGLGQDFKPIQLRVWDFGPNTAESAQEKTLTKSKRGLLGCIKISNRISYL